MGRRGHVPFLAIGRLREKELRGYGDGGGAAIDIDI